MKVFLTIMAVIGIGLFIYAVYDDHKKQNEL